MLLGKGIMEVNNLSRVRVFIPPGLEQAQKDRRKIQDNTDPDYTFAQALLDISDSRTDSYNRS